MYYWMQDMAMSYWLYNGAIMSGKYITYMWINSNYEHITDTTYHVTSFRPFNVKRMSYTANA